MLSSISNDRAPGITVRTNAALGFYASRQVSVAHGRLATVGPRLRTMIPGMEEGPCEKAVAPCDDDEARLGDLVIGLYRHVCTGVNV
jgi:hypothetical protein